MLYTSKLISEKNMKYDFLNFCAPSQLFWQRRKIAPVVVFFIKNAQTRRNYTTLCTCARTNITCACTEMSEHVSVKFFFFPDKVTQESLV